MTKDGEGSEEVLSQRVLQKNKINYENSFLCLETMAVVQMMEDPERSDIRALQVQWTAIHTQK